MAHGVREGLVVAIDGPAASGKSTVARRLAEDLGWAYLDTGALYRALTLAALERDVAPGDVNALVGLGASLVLEVAVDGRVLLDGRDVSEDIRSPAVTDAVSVVAAHADVRRLMVTVQRAVAARAGRVVTEGRDIGTVVFPDARVKVYLDADLAVRARRRWAQEGRAGGTDEAAAVGRVRADIEERDRRDRSRAASPLRQAEDAWHLDTTDMTLDEVLAAVRSHVRSRIPVGSGPGGAA